MADKPVPIKPESLDTVEKLAVAARVDKVIKGAETDGNNIPERAAVEKVILGKGEDYLKRITKEYVQELKEQCGPGLEKCSGMQDVGANSAPNVSGQGDRQRER